MWQAVSVAERRHGLPPGLLFAISQVESGRPDPATRRREPWPWTVQAADQSLYFDSKTQAVQWVRDAMARGITSIDTGCLQVNLFFHPRAFETIDDAFDPRRNADYAKRDSCSSSMPRQVTGGRRRAPTIRKRSRSRRRTKRELNAH